MNYYYSFILKRYSDIDNTSMVTPCFWLNYESKNKLFIFPLYLVINQIMIITLLSNL